MSLSQAFMNSGALESLSPAAMEANRSTMSAWMSARRKAAAMIVASTKLRTIARIDLNVLFSEVARPETRASRASAMQQHLYQAFLVVQFFLELRFGEIRGNAPLANQYALQMDIHP